MLFAIISLGGLGFVLGAGLSIASKKFAVEIDPREEAVLKALPGANCGACGFPGCGGFAAAVARGDAPVIGCTAGGVNTAKALGVIMGVEADVVKKVARVYCKGGDKETTKKFMYAGIQNCTAATLIAGGNKTCPYGCVGLGTCAVVCPFDAIRMENGLPVVDEEKCTGCGKCEKACPKYTIRVIPADSKVVVTCNSTDKGAVVKKYCSTGCIGCGICVKVCPKQAITMENSLAYIHFEKCDNCGLCATKCPTKNIINYLETGPSHRAEAA